MTGQKIQCCQLDSLVTQTVAKLFRIEARHGQKSFGTPDVGNDPPDHEQGDGLRIGLLGVGCRHGSIILGHGELVTKRVIVVEDNALNLRLFCDLLTAHGHETCAVRDGREAFDKAVAFRPDVIVTDIQLPHVSGIELIQQFRDNASLAQVPIMAVTAYAAPGDEDRIRAAGANAYVSKPISVAKFMTMMNELFDAVA
jgi:two-component system cell cycle response regulator DivK